MSSKQAGNGYAFIAFVMWGLFPLYFKMIDHLAPLAVLANRVLWACIVLVLLVSLMRQWQRMADIFKHFRQYAVSLLLTTVLIAINWGFYVWAVNNNFIFEASLGYYINPLLNIFLGYIFLSERLRKAQWFAVVLALIGVSIETIAYGQVPWIALTISFAFGFYGLLHKQMSVESLPGLAIESLLLLPIAVFYLVYLSQFEASLFNPINWSLRDWFLLSLSGPITVVPLLLFTVAARRISLVNLGFLQYIAPTILFLLAAFVYDQAYSPIKILTFVFIWGALIIVSIDALHYKHKTAKILS